MIKNIKYLFIPILIASCSSNKIYRDINKTVTSYSEEHNYKIELERKWNPTKVIFQQLKDSLTKPTDIIYIFEWGNTAYEVARIDFFALVYDRNTGKKFYIENDNGFDLDIQNKSDEFVSFDFLLENYLLGKADYLHTLDEPIFDDSFMYDDCLLIEINSRNKTIHTFGPMYFDEDGNPVTREDLEKAFPLPD